MSHEGESRFYVEEGIEITKPRSFRQSAEDKDLTVIENIDSVIHVETNVVNDVPCLLPVGLLDTIQACVAFAGCLGRGRR